MKNQNHNNVETPCYGVSGIFIPFTQSELEKVYRYCGGIGLETDGMGIKRLLLDVISEQEQDEENDRKRHSTIDNIANIIIDNPQIITGGLSAVKKFVDRIKK